MRRRTKLDFELLSLEETAKELGIPHKRARGILKMVGVKGEPNLRISVRSGRRVACKKSVGAAKRTSH
jgi:hypothetical protein